MQKSLQLHFLNNLKGYAISLVKGSKLIDEVSSIHNIGPHAIDFYKKTIITSVQMVNFLKSTESIGFYIDSDSPYYRFKIEISSEGSLRTLLLPEEFSDFPSEFNGTCRIHKSFVGKSPYTSILKFKNEPLQGLINQVIEQSYQVNSKVFLSDNFDSSLMVTILPPTNVDSKVEDLDPQTLEDIERDCRSLFDQALNQNFSEISQFENIFEKAGCTYLGSKELKFYCPCSKDRMIENLFTLTDEDRKHIFEKKAQIEIRCDYCNTTYQIEESDLTKTVH